jgi:hypothetical protein
MTAAAVFTEHTIRRDLWCELGATDAQGEELLAYTGDAYESVVPVATDGALPDEPFVDTWQEYASESDRIGGGVCLKRHLVQLQFPIARGMSETPAYGAATRRGDVSDLPDVGGAIFAAPNGIRIFLHDTAAGRVPVVLAEERADFETLVRALTHRNEPATIPPSMGACIVAGYNNWERIARLRAAWENGATDKSTAAWWVAFRALADRRDLYQDRFILLSSGPYSGLSADTLGLTESRWRTLSVTIRLEHECTHYLTRRLLGAMRNCLLDELIADYAGIVAACGRYRADWFLNFMGLECFPARSNGRLGNYRGNPSLSDGAFEVLQRAVVRAAVQLERIDARSGHEGRTLQGRARLAIAFARVGLERLAGSQAEGLLDAMLR